MVVLGACQTFKMKKKKAVFNNRSNLPVQFKISVQGGMYKGHWNQTPSLFYSRNPVPSFPPQDKSSLLEKEKIYI